MKCFRIGIAWMPETSNLTRHEKAERRDTFSIRNSSARGRSTATKPNCFESVNPGVYEIRGSPECFFVFFLPCSQNDARLDPIIFARILSTTCRSKSGDRPRGVKFGGISLNPARTSGVKGYPPSNFTPSCNYSVSPFSYCNGETAHGVKSGEKPTQRC
jgi:hypothetical protein